jgi:hypothetical protein
MWRPASAIPRWQLVQLFAPWADPAYRDLNGSPLWQPRQVEDETEA